MCISSTGYPETAREDIIGYKIFLANTKGTIGPLFRTLTAKETMWYKQKNNSSDNFDGRKVKRIYPMPEGKLLKARHFNMRRGFSLFSTPKQTEKFLVDFHYNKILPSKRNLIVRKVIIPKGTLFEIGRIGIGFIGEGIQAIRAEKIIIQKEK